MLVSLKQLGNKWVNTIHCGKSHQGTCKIATLNKSNTAFLSKKMSRRESWLTAYWISKRHSPKPLISYTRMRANNLLWISHWWKDRKQWWTLLVSFRSGWEYPEEFFRNLIRGLCFSVYLGQRCPQTLFRTEKIRVNCENMQDFSTGSSEEVKQEMKFGVHKHKSRKKGKNAS